MVLTNEEYREAKTDSKLSPLFKLRNDTKSYIIQCLADREIQYIVNSTQHQSKAYRHNCEVIHSPVKYADVEAVLNGTGWNSATCNPCKPRILPHLRTDTRDGQQLNKILKLKSKITHLEMTIADLKAENVRQCQKNQQLTRLTELEALVTSKERAVLTLKASNERLQRELNNTLNLVDRLKKEKNELKISVKNNKEPTIRGTRMDWISYSDPHSTSYLPENNGYSTAYRGVSNVFNKGKTSSDASSKMNLRNLFIFAGVGLIAYNKPELGHSVLKKLVTLSRIISVYSLLSFRKIFTWSIFLVDLPLNVLATK